MSPSNALVHGDFFMDRGFPGVMKTYHKHHHIEINYLLKGEMKYLFNGEVVQISTGMFTLFWAGLPHQMIERSEGVEMIWIYLPLSWFMSWNLPKEFKGEVLQGGLLWDQLPTDTAMLERWHIDCAKGGELQEISILEIEARLRRMGLKYKKVSQKSDETISPLSNKITTICSYLSDHLDEEITADKIAKHVHLHPNYMMTIFKKELGYSITQYITRLRIAKAQRLLVTTDQKVLQIAYSCGFQTPSRFYTAFHEVAECTPKEFKRQCLK